MQRIINADAITGLRQLDAESVHVVVTSPPYFGLRDYERCPCASVHSGEVGSSTLEPGPKSGNTQMRNRTPDPNCVKCHGTGKQADLSRVWGGSADCPHQWIDEGTTVKQPKPDHSGYDHKLGTRGEQGHAAAVGGERNHGHSCAKCGAWRGQLGLEPTPDLYIAHLVEVFRELKRVLRDDGVAWLNIGDSYWDEGNLLLIPFRLALALQADGWIVRSDVIWAKGASFGPYVGNVMPEPCNGWRWERHKIKVSGNRSEEDMYEGSGRGDWNATPVGNKPWNDYVDCPGCEVCTPNDGLVLKKQAWRPTKTHEYVFLLAKTGSYYCDKDAIAEPLSRSSMERLEQDSFWEQEGGEKDGLNPNRSARKAIENLARKVGTRVTPEEQAEMNAQAKEMFPDYFGESVKGHDGAGVQNASDVKRSVLKGLQAQYMKAGASVRENHAYGEIGGRPIGPSSFARPILKRNVRSVFTIGPQPYTEAHFAVFPPRLIEPMLKVSTSEKGCCAACGTQWSRAVGESFIYKDRAGQGSRGEIPSSNRAIGQPQQWIPRGEGHETIGFRTSCECKAGTVPPTALDPFAGSGTTMAVAKSLGLSSIGIEPNPAYIPLIEKRLNETVPAPQNAGDAF